MNRARIGIIGGSGLYQMPGLTDVEEITLDTPFGAPSDKICVGRLAGVEVAFLARHGRSHSWIPSQIPYRANIYALKSLGVQYLLSVSAVGSMREEIAPLDMVLPDQFIDLTRRREGSFFGDGAVAHVSLADPVCPVLSQVMADAFGECDLQGIRLHRGGTYVCIEGPAFSTRAESIWFRGMGASVIGMTNMPEVRLAREAEIAYATLALATDWDCWHPHQACVTAEMAISNLRGNAERAQRLLRRAVERLAAEWPTSTAHTALDAALVTPIPAMTAEVRQRLAALLARRETTAVGS
ncbi:S-methyl-5'-thioadenosine phosphorylase [Roseateles puraquae]|jgi:5'-methylthioadenosine phosphorylase|uniref:S-methyl-5'-thioadenosine phosphorylase n=2 Tax=Roseateles puraquae TaxID=431059 RepID=A0A254N0X7_9BURK|nr:S-methyl-5'-thioadenosine phosphorylase [Roseateles puraquae]MDG0854420.1 S-methyl-5'-thioadenosine phosphorylase [Roseateles puraquae]OWR00818.1 S-methyl-5'-thioadenosine phosphorylase [Roseateles puraquae]RTL38359.1 MAG: S-methyl-5'-thioadenosine phosphorylase [Burkholderiales bacterium]